ncbi:MAG: hypothetical protein [Caudoviricetes sp.]|nr:MAG: hypothetical protein [Caudoviricetes sp.]
MVIRTYDSNYRGECRSEMCEQMDCASWLEFNHPDRWPLIFHVPNEIRANPQYMQRRKKEGVKPGVSDLIDFCAVRGAFELKRRDKSKCKVSKEQREFLEATAASGGFAAICYGFEQFRVAYADYLIFVAQNS